MNSKSKRIRHLVISLLAALTLIASMAVLSFAAEANENVNNARSGVVHVRTYYKANDGTEYEVMWGSGFLINDMTVMTCHHVIYPDAEVMQDMRNNEIIGPMIEGKSDAQVLEKMVIKVIVYADSSLTAEVAEGVDSENADFVALKLKSPLSDYKPLAIRDTKANPVSATEACYVLGFPYKMQYFKIDPALRFAQENVEVTPGTVKKMDDVGGVMTIIMSDTVTSGYSGGPMVDADGNVIGIAKWRDDLDDNQSYATASQEFLPVLTTLGIDYTAADAAPAADDSKNETAEDEEKSDTEEVPAPTQTEPTQKKSTNMIPFIIGGVAVVILGVLAALLLSRKKKDDPLQSAGSTYTPAGGPVPPAPGAGSPVSGGQAPAVPPIGGFPGGQSPDTSVLNQGANETTVLGQGAGETSVLSSTQVSGSITRDKTGEKINISKENFKIGRERARVDYCISDNTAIGRHHATIIVRNGDAYLVDQNSRNFTFVNDVKVSPNVETKLKDGDKISFADEVYTYHTR